jgi:hypothetical protein
MDLVGGAEELRDDRVDVLLSLLESIALLGLLMVVRGLDGVHSVRDVVDHEEHRLVGQRKGVEAWRGRL